MQVDYMILLYVFVLAIFAGYEVITKVPPILHTPLMSGANAISGVCLIGAMIVAGPAEWNISVILGLIAVIMATHNVVGGYMVTDRMLAMFRKE
jgi:NAD(P) transhydrogenase subunit alpha